NQIKQVIMNFIKNAIEAMIDGGKINITVKKVKQKKISIEIKDEGPGIEEERLKFIGTPFYTTKEKGIGLGLTISHKIIQEHGGSMNINSKLGEGTIVDVVLPYKYSIMN